MNTTSRNNITYILALLILATVIFSLYLLLAQGNHFSSLEPLINGTAPRPFVYRVLPTLIMGVLSDAFHFSSDLSAIILMYASMIGFSFSMLGLLKYFLPSSHALPLSLLAPIGLIPLLVNQRHVYDLPFLFLFTLAMYLLAKSDFRNYLIVFFFASLTKETSIFLVFFFVLQFVHLDRKRLIKITSIQLVIFAFVRLTLMFIYKNNPGSIMEFHLAEHLSAYLHAPLEAISLFVTLVLIGIAAFRKRNHQNFIRNCLLTIGIPNFFLILLTGLKIITLG